MVSNYKKSNYWLHVDIKSAHHVTAPVIGPGTLILYRSESHNKLPMQDTTTGRLAEGRKSIIPVSLIHFSSAMIASSSPILQLCSTGGVPNYDNNYKVEINCKWHLHTGCTRIKRTSSSSSWWSASNFLSHSYSTQQLNGVIFLSRNLSFAFTLFISGFLCQVNKLRHTAPLLLFRTEPVVETAYLSYLRALYIL